jgi:hypothetical protein
MSPACKSIGTDIQTRDLVLQHNSIAETDMSQIQKLLYKWLRPYRVQKAIPEKGTYILEEFNGQSWLAPI